MILSRVYTTWIYSWILAPMMQTSVLLDELRFLAILLDKDFSSTLTGEHRMNSRELDRGCGALKYFDFMWESVSYLETTPWFIVIVGKKEKDMMKEDEIFKKLCTEYWDEEWVEMALTIVK